MSNTNKIGYMINESGCVCEATIIKSGDRVTAQGCVQTGGERNRNGRIYRTEDLIREINAPRQRELLEAGQMLGEAGHPIGPTSDSLIRQQTIDPTNTCVRFLKFWNEGDNIMATFQGTNNALGETFDKDLRQGVKPAFSLRALGTIQSTPQGAVVNNLKMITYDYVIYPSHPGAYTQGVLSESANMMASPVSGFKLNKGNDSTKSFIKEFTNADALAAIKKSKAVSESCIDYIKDKSNNFHLLKEAFDMTKFDTIDLIDTRHVALTEAGKATIIMDVEDYISKELQNYRG